MSKELGTALAELGTALAELDTALAELDTALAELDTEVFIRFAGKKVSVYVDLVYCN